MSREIYRSSMNGQIDVKWIAKMMAIVIKQKRKRRRERRRKWRKSDNEKRAGRNPVVFIKPWISIFFFFFFFWFWFIFNLMFCIWGGYMCFFMVVCLCTSVFESRGLQIMHIYFTNIMVMFHWCGFMLVYAFLFLFYFYLVQAFLSKHILTHICMYLHTRVHAHAHTYTPT